MSSPLHTALGESLALLEGVLAGFRPRPTAEEIGTVLALRHGIADVIGLPGVQSEELVRLGGGTLGLAFNLEPESVGVVLLGTGEGLSAGCAVRRSRRILDVPVGESLLGRVVDALGRPLDGGPPPIPAARFPVERPAPAIVHRAPVAQPLQTGIKVVDALVPIGKGQRELILGDRQTGKSTLALDTILNQRDKNVLCVYCAIGQRGASVARLIATLRERGAMSYTVVVVASGEEPPGVQFIAPYAATSVAEYFVECGRDVLIVYDDLTRHARAYRELSLLLRRPPGREAYPGDIFYVHSRLLERSTRLIPARGGGSLTALPVLETQAENLSGYIPTNLISITDGQIYLSPELFRKGVLPAVDVGRSVSRVGGKAQLPCFRGVAGELRLAYAQFEELETFSRFGTRLDEATVRTLERGRRIREVLRQTQGAPLSAAEQVVALFAASQGFLDGVPLEKVAALEATLRETVRARLSDLCRRMEAGESLSDEDRQALSRCLGEMVALSGGNRS